MEMPTNIPPFWGWTRYTPVIPKMYWDVYSQEERIKRLCRDHDKLAHYASYLGTMSIDCQPMIVLITLSGSPCLDRAVVN